MFKKLLVASSLATLVACSPADDQTTKNAENKDKGITISEIQGTNHRSSYEGKMVEKVSGVVTGLIKSKYQNGFFMQSLNSDKDDRTAEGIYIENKTNIEVATGNVVKVSGVVKEISFNKPKDGDLTITSIEANSIEVTQKEGIKVEAILLDSTKIPSVVHTGTVGELDINKNAMDLFESYEGMLVKVKTPTVVGANEKYGEVYIIENDGEHTKNRTENGGARYTYGDEQTRTFIVEGKVVPFTKHKKFINPQFTPNPGDKFKGDIEGIMAFNYGGYKIFNTTDLPELEDRATKREVNAIVPNEDKLSIVSYNVENFTVADGQERIKGLSDQIINLLKLPDIVGLIEVGDDDGSKDSDVLKSDKTLQAIVDQIKKDSGVEYGYLYIAPEAGKDGGWPAMHIRNAFIYKKDRVTLPYINEGASNIDTEIKGNQLTFNPGRLGTNNPNFDEVRKTLVGHFNFKGKDVFVLANHLKSKRSDSKVYSSIRPVVRKSEDVRIPEGEFIGAFLKELTQKFPDAVVVSLGDMNDFEFSPTMQAMKTDAMVNAIELLPENERHSYVYKGNSQVLDNLLVNKKYAKNMYVNIVNVNAEFFENQGRISDHDPVYVQIDMQ